MIDLCIDWVAQQWLIGDDDCHQTRRGASEVAGRALEPDGKALKPTGRAIVPAGSASEAQLDSLCGEGMETKTLDKN